MAKQWKFSPSALGWYLVGVDYPNAPDDLLDVPTELWASLQGKPLEVGPDGMPREKVLTPPTQEQRKAALLAAVDEHLNAAARARGYDDRNTFYMRAAATGSPFQTEGIAFALWMDAVYAKCYEVLAAVQSGAITEPTREELLALLPVLTLPITQGA